MDCKVPGVAKRQTRQGDCALQESASQSCVGSGSSVVGLMVTSSEKTTLKPFFIPNPQHNAQTSQAPKKDSVFWKQEGIQPARKQGFQGQLFGTVWGHVPTL